MSKNILSASLTGSILAALLLSACSTLDLPNAYRLKKTNPQEMSPEHGRVAVIWPKDIYSKDFVFDFTFKEGNGAAPVNEVFTLEIDETTQPLVKLPKGENLGELTVYRLPEAQQARAETFKTTLIERGPKAAGTGQLTSSFRFGIRPENKAAQRYCEDRKSRKKAPFYAWVKVNEAEPFRRIVRTRSIEKIFKGSVGNICWQLERSAKESTLSQNP